MIEVVDMFQSVSLDDIYNLLRVWFYAWIIFNSYKLLATHTRRIGGLFRSSAPGRR